MSKITFGPATTEALQHIEGNLRPLDALEFFYATGKPPKGYFAQDARRHGPVVIGSVGGVPACAFGVADRDTYGAPWLLGTSLLQGREVARAMLTEGRALFGAWARLYGTLRNFAYADNALHLRYIRMLGCTIHPPQPYGAFGVPFVEFTYGLQRPRTTQSVPPRVHAKAPGSSPRRGAGSVP